jgi:hypothetical protein
VRGTYNESIDFCRFRYCRWVGKNPSTSSSTQKNPPQKDLWNPAFSISNYHMQSKIEVAMIKDKSA